MSASVATASESVSDTRFIPAHRFWAPRARARSTRIWRIDRAAMPTKWLPVVPGRAGAGKAQIGLVDERRRLQRLARALATHVGAGQPAKLVVHGGASS